jgi:hypothetical protein
MVKKRSGNPSTKENNIKVDIWHPTVGLRCMTPPRHFSQLKTRAISLIETPVGKNFAVRDIFFMGYSSWGFNQRYWLKCLSGFLHLKPTAGCQMSTLLFKEKNVEGVSINI